mmetsp:Transcript_3563/g.13641  ORF Transcript_3563/g.13641 Transcript_3563/m.13641 type:complete len:213 (-) Transcript_3563:493-1131(-)
MLSQSPLLLVYIPPLDCICLLRSVPFHQSMNRHLLVSQLSIRSSQFQFVVAVLHPQVHVLFNDKISQLNKSVQQRQILEFEFNQLVELQNVLIVLIYIVNAHRFLARDEICPALPHLHIWVEFHVDLVQQPIQCIVYQIKTIETREVFLSGGSIHNAHHLVIGPSCVDVCDVLIHKPVVLSRRELTQESHACRVISHVDGKIKHGTTEIVPL